MADEEDRAALAQRLEAVRVSAALPEFVNKENVIDALNGAGVTVWFHGVLSDREIGDKLHALHSRQPDLFQEPTLLNGAGPRLDHGFRQFLGGLADKFHDLKPDTKRALLQRYEASKDSGSKPSEAEMLRRQLELRHGDVSKAPALDRARLAILEGQRQTTAAQPNAAQSAALNALPTSRRLEASRALSEVQKLNLEAAQIRASAPAALGVTMGRASRLEQIEQRITRLRQLFPNVLAV